MSFETGTPTLVDEVTSAIKSMKEGKAAGPDKIPTEIIKFMNEKTVKMITAIFNRIFMPEDIPHKWLKSTTLKKSGTNHAKNIKFKSPCKTFPKNYSLTNI